MLLKCSWCQLVFLTTRGTFTGDFEITRRVNPKATDSIAIAMASAATHHLYVIIATASIEPANLSHFLIAKEHSNTIVHSDTISLLHLFFERLYF